MRSVSTHTSPLREVIHALKFEGVRVLAGPLGELLADYWLPLRIGVDVVVPVPLHSARVRQRGYNQSALLASIFGAHTELPLEPQLLVRERATRPQLGLSRSERRLNVRDAFRCPSSDLSAMRVLLIDDVLTTGATLEAAASALRACGAAEVWALTVARAMPRLYPADLPPSKG